MTAEAETTGTLRERVTALRDDARRRQDIDSARYMRAVDVAEELTHTLDSTVSDSVTVYELKPGTATGGSALFFNLDAAKTRADEVFTEWKKFDETAADGDAYEYVDELSWAMEGDPRGRWTAETLTAWHCTTRGDRDNWAFTIVEREVLGSAPQG